MARDGYRIFDSDTHVGPDASILDRCDEGPVMVIYPGETWYTYVDQHDIDEIIDEHLVDGRVVERLKI